MVNNSSIAHQETNIEENIISGVGTSALSVPTGSEDVTLQIKKEKLDIAKEWIQTGEVNVYRETFTEDENFTVPVTREELVVEKKELSSSIQKGNRTPKDIIRIPLSEEHVEFTKHEVALEDVSIYKQQINDIECIEVPLKMEKAKIKIIGSQNL